MFTPLRVLALLAALMLAACASVDAKKIAKFGEATTEVAQIVAHVPEVADKVAAQDAFEDQATTFESRSGDPSFPPAVPDRDEKLRKIWAVRIGTLNAISNYGAALAAAASGEDATKLDSAVGNLKTAVNTVPTVAKNERFQGAASLVQSTSKRLFTHVSDARLREAITEAHPLIVKSAALLTTDLENVGSIIEGNYKSWLRAKKLILRDAREDGTSADLYSMYQQFSKDFDEMQVTIAFFRPQHAPRYKELLSKMVDAHAALKTPDADAVKIDDFVSAVKEMADAFKQLNNK
ncbi:hypothetical protein [Rhizobium sp. 2MFCol3.1]|uniref:hypothetical protein n=1 Tax=Rhizobium sp. 2MFCol3.1 TaxID=1246459 RepID=UPI00037E3AC1|nr:hypothetical protein [Rhizobium sp. 2MFCol3.1]